MKSIRIIIFTMIGILILGSIGVGIAYFTTDIFTSNQNMFYKYISQENASDFFDINFIKEFTNKLKSEENETDGKIIINANVDGEDILENSKIAFNNKLDKSNEFWKSKLTFGNGESSDLLEVEILKNEDIYGVKIKDVITQYFAVKNKNLKQFTNKLGFNANKLNIPDEIKVDDYSDKINDIEDKMTQDLSEIFAYVKNEVPKGNYSKIQKTNIKINEINQEVRGYKLTLNNDQTSKILSKLDEQYMEKINSFLEKFTEKQINQETLNTEVILYIKDKNIVKIGILINDNENLSINLSKTFTQSDLKYELEVSNDENKLKCNITKSLEEEMQNIKYVANLSISSESNNYKATLNIETNTTFDADFTVTEFDNDNSVIANDMEASTLIGVLKIIGQKVYDETEYKDTIIGLIIQDLSILKTVQNASASMKNTSIEIHNSMFQQYEGSQKGNAVKSLINIIETNNATSGNNMVNVLYNEAQEQIEIDNSTEYKVSFKYDDEGYISTININEQ